MARARSNALDDGPPGICTRLYCFRGRSRCLIRHFAYYQCHGVRLPQPVDSQGAFAETANEKTTGFSKVNREQMRGIHVPAWRFSPASGRQ